MQDARQAGDGRDRRARHGVSRKAECGLMGRGVSRRVGVWGLGPHSGPPASREPPESPESAPATASAAESGCGGLAPTAALLHLVNLLNLLSSAPATASAARQFHFAQKSRLTFGGSFAIIIIILLPDTPAGPRALLAAMRHFPRRREGRKGLGTSPFGPSGLSTVPSPCGSSVSPGSAACASTPSICPNL